MTDMDNNNVQAGDTIAVWFSCGAASAVAAKTTIAKYPQCRIKILNNFIAEEEADNRRFLHDVEKWLGVTIEDVRNPTYPNGSCVEVWETRKFMSGVGGAPCTSNLKFNARLKWEAKNPCDWLVMGFTVDEAHRHDSLVEIEPKLLPVLIDENITKEECFKIVNAAGLKLPSMYEKGYPNANCPGCVKATSPTYWNLVRVQHPEVFAARAEQSRRLGAKLVRVKGERIYLDDLDPKATGRPLKEMKIECGIFCPYD
jgi:hypothetical protein|tara:strand:- start:37 stop:804 length:768 start_codon:yes stop_codon:yes gene_type:complete